MTPAATDRDIRWHRNFLRGTVGACWMLLTIGLWSLFTSHHGLQLLLTVLVFTWWASGVSGALRHSVLMSRGMAVTVGHGVERWRRLPREVRDRARPVADGLVAAGVRYDTAGVHARALLLDRVETQYAGRPYPGYRDDVDELQAWLDGAKEIHRD